MDTRATGRYEKDRHIPDQETLRHVGPEEGSGRGNADLPFGLSLRERDVLKLMARGCNNAEIAARLFISPHTVKNHVTRIYKKMGEDDRTKVALMAVRLGIVPLEPETREESEP